MYNHKLVCVHRRVCNTTFLRLVFFFCFFFGVTFFYLNILTLPFKHITNLIKSHDS